MGANREWGLMPWDCISVLTKLLVKTGSDIMDALAFAKNFAVMREASNTCWLLVGDSLSISVQCSVDFQSQMTKSLLVNASLNFDFKSMSLSTFFHYVYSKNGWRNGSLYWDSVHRTIKSPVLEKNRCAIINLKHWGAMLKMASVYCHKGLNYWASHIFLVLFFHLFLTKNNNLIFLRSSIRT